MNATNITTVQVSSFKGYKGENTWRVQWSFSNRLLDVYLNVTTGNIVGIEEKTGLSPTPVATEAPSVTNMVVSPTPAYSGTPIEFSAEVTDALSGVRDVKAIISKGCKEVATVFMLDPEDEGIYTGIWHTMVFSDGGIYNIEIVARDNVGNVASVKAPDVELVIDKEGPPSLP